MSNHLINEKSPYLLQHADNPVNWRPWSTEAFEKAAKEDKPVFLSVGYSTCHWCHVMARESFEDTEIARILNSRYVPVKVDREERPEVDAVYMSVCVAMTGQGGWPLTVIMTPDRKPFFSGTYFPSRSKYNMTGLLEILTEVANLWESDRKRLLRLSEEILSALRDRNRAADGSEPSWELAERGFRELEAAFDRGHGGFGKAPKFPSPHNLLFLLALYSEKNQTDALAMAEKTLVSMARGGIHDQIGGGFSRYSTDEQWLVPHFEKTLYDNALLTLAYLEAYRLTHRDYYRKTAEKTLAYVDRELTDEKGGFYCGQDADSDGVEGKYYVFSEAEIGRFFEDKEEKDDFCRWFGITERGNFEGKNIPNLIRNQNYEVDNLRMDTLSRRIYEYRLKRTRLHKDDKILTSWNAMMIMAYARAGFLLRSDAYLRKAKKAREFVEKYLADVNDRLQVRYRDGETAFFGNLDDYAYYSLALLSLYEATLNVSYLEAAVCRAGQMADLFWDDENGGFYFYGRDAQKLIQRPKEIYDGAVPSGNSAAAHVLAALSRLTANPKWEKLASRQFSFLAAGANEYPSAHCFSLTAFINVLSTGKELICASSENKVPEELQAYRKSPENRHVSVLFKCPDNEERLAKVAPFTGEYKLPKQGVLYYLCENHACGLPSDRLPQTGERL